jgi:hypothetical protein
MESGRDFSLSTALSDGWRYVFGAFPAFVRVSWVYFVSAVIAGLAITTLSYVFPSNEPVHYTAGTVAVLFIMVLSVAYYVAATRHYLLGEQTPRIWPCLPTVVVRIFLYTVVILAVLAVAVVIALGMTFAMAYWTALEEEVVDTLGTLAIIGFVIIALIFVFYITARVCLWFVAPCIGKPMSLRESWAATRVGHLRIFAGLLIIGIPFGVLDAAVEAAPPAILRSSEDIFQMMFAGNYPVAVSLALIAKIIVYFIQFGIYAGFAGSVYRQKIS